MSRTRDAKDSAWAGANFGICCGVAIVVVTIIVAIFSWLMMILPP